MARRRRKHRSDEENGSPPVLSLARAGKWVALTALGAAISVVVSAPLTGLFDGRDGPAPPPPPPFPASRLVSSEKVGHYAVEQDGESQGALDVFGQPGKMTRSGVECRMRWKDIGLEMSFHNLGGQDPCLYGSFCSARITQQGWATTRGVEIGESIRRAWDLYEEEDISDEGVIHRWLLEPGVEPCGEDARGGLEADSMDGRIIAFRVTFQAGGD